MESKNRSCNNGDGDLRIEHSLPVKHCVVCGKLFTWRKKWESCWDEVLSCSQRCKNEHRAHTRSRVATAAAISAASQCVQSADVLKSEELSGSGDEWTESLATSGNACTQPVLVDLGTFSDVVALVGAASEQCDELTGLHDADYDDGKYHGLPEARACPPDARRARKEEAKALKARRRSQRVGSPTAAAAKQKPCDECNRFVDLLIRCTSDASQQWHMLCGRCWNTASGGVPDGDTEHPYYRYGGLWKNRAASVRTPNFGSHLPVPVSQAFE